MLQNLELTNKNSPSLRKYSLTPKLKKSPVKESGKLRLDCLLEESSRLVDDTKFGKKSFRYLTPSPPPIGQKIKNNSFLLETDTKKFAYINFLNGKTEEFGLPSFKEFTNFNTKLHYETGKLFKQIEKCDNDLKKFEKKMNGLEFFCKNNPGVLWNNDKTILLKLGSNHSNKLALIKAYNEKRENLGSKSSKRNSFFFRKLNSVSVDRKESFNMPTISELGQSPEKKSALKVEKVEKAEKAEKFEKPEKSEDFEEKKNCLEEFKQSRIELADKMDKIFTKIQLDRPDLMRRKAGLIFQDKERYKGKIHSFRQMKVFKRKMENLKLGEFAKVKSQVNLYTQMLEYLKDYKGMPKQCMITFVEAVKYLLEGGWVLNSYTLSQILSHFSQEAQSDLAPLISMYQSYLSHQST